MKKAAVFLVCLVAALTLTFPPARINVCATDTITDTEATSKEAEALMDTKAGDLYLTVNNREVYYPEVMVYYLGSKDELETAVGNNDFWNREVDGHTVDYLVMDDIRRELIQLKVIVTAAENRGLSLTNEEENELMETARAQMQNVSAEIKAKNYIDDNVLYKVYHDNFLAAKLYRTYLERFPKTYLAEREFKRDFRGWYKTSKITITDKWTGVGP